jgi:DNA-binding winged helix-turn-helix (wHTH) protein
MSSVLEHRCIGDWTFHPEENELRGPAGCRRLEHRAARTLELLCGRRGQVVSKDEIVENVWEGRLVSPNSVAIVISDLREALGDDPRTPRHIETLAKRGYRLTAQEAPRPELQPANSSRHRLLSAGAILLLLLTAITATVLVLRSEGSEVRPIIAVGNVVNATGTDAYQPLADATSEVLIGRAGGIEGFTVVRSPSTEGSIDHPARQAEIELSARLVIWSGKPSVMFIAIDRETGAVLWNATIAGGEDIIPTGTAAAMQSLSATLRAKRKEGFRT